MYDIIRALVDADGWDTGAKVDIEAKSIEVVAIMTTKRRTQMEEEKKVRDDD